MRTRPNIRDKCAFFCKFMLEALSSAYQPDPEKFGKGAGESYIGISVANQYSGNLLETVFRDMVFSEAALIGSPKFTPLARLRYRLTEKFNSVILGELLDDMGMEFAVDVRPSGFIGRVISGRERLRYDSQLRDGDIMDGINFTALKKRFERRKNKRKNG